MKILISWSRRQLRLLLIYSFSRKKRGAQSGVLGLLDDAPELVVGPVCIYPGWDALDSLPQMRKDGIIVAIGANQDSCTNLSSLREKGENFVQCEFPYGTLRGWHMGVGG